MAKVEGGCLCQSVRFKGNLLTSDKSTALTVCHCQMCRRWSGSAYIAYACGSDAEFTGKENITRYRSSEWAERAFCSKCGSALFYRSLQENSPYSMSAGLLDDQSGFGIGEQVCIDRKSDFYSLQSDAPCLTEEETYRKYAG